MIISYLCNLNWIITSNFKDMKTKTSVIILLFTLLSYPVLAAEKIKGNGNLVSKENEISDYNKIRVNGLYDIYYTQSDDSPYLEITVDDNLMPYVHVTIKDRVLSIGFKGAKVESFTKFIIKTNSRWLKEVQAAGNAGFYLESPLQGDEFVVKSSNNCLVQLKHKVEMGKINLKISGAANIIAEELVTEKLSCNITGTGSMNLQKGTANEGSFDIMNSGVIHASGIEIKNATCKVAGSGMAEINATDNLKINVLGNATVRYKGTADVEQRKIGKGTIEEIK